MRAAAHQPAPKCRHCQGWAFEPDRPGFEICTACGGTGRPPAAPAVEKTGELIDG